jgi:nicotinamidase-related amidase
MQAADAYIGLADRFNDYQIKADDAALLIIDPQRSFTRGVWMTSIGNKADKDVKPIAMAFDACAGLLKAYYGRMNIMFTRCPFPPDSYGWDDRFSDLIDSNQLYFIKPGNSVLFPPRNGFREWICHLDDSGKQALVIGGCTLNSCVRISAIDTLVQLRPRNLQVLVDLSLCGARLSNYRPSSTWGGLSAVESAVDQMTASGVKVVTSVKWI